MLIKVTLYSYFFLNCWSNKLISLLILFYFSILFSPLFYLFWRTFPPLNRIWNIYANYGLVQGLWFSFLFVFFFPHWLILNLELQILVLHKTRGTRHNLMLIVYYLRMHIIRSNIRIRLWDNLYVCILSNIVYVYYIQFRKDFGALREKKN